LVEGLGLLGITLRGLGLVGVGEGEGQKDAHHLHDRHQYPHHTHDQPSPPGSPSTSPSRTLLSFLLPQLESRRRCHPES
jgi:hypothetical protein